MIISLKFASIFPGLNTKPMRLIVFPVAFIGAIFSIIFSIPLNDSLLPKSLKSKSVRAYEYSWSMWKIFDPSSDEFGTISPCLLPLIISFTFLTEIPMILRAISKFDMILILCKFFKGNYIGLPLKNGLVLDLLNELNFEIEFISWPLITFWWFLKGRSNII